MKVKGIPEIAEIMFCAGILENIAKRRYEPSDKFRLYIESVYKWLLEISKYSSVEEYFEEKFGEKGREAKELGWL